MVRFITLSVACVGLLCCGGCAGLNVGMPMLNLGPLSLGMEPIRLNTSFGSGSAQPDAGFEGGFGESGFPESGFGSFPESDFSVAESPGGSFPGSGGSFPGVGGSGGAGGKTPILKPASDRPLITIPKPKPLSRPKITLPIQNTQNKALLRK